MPSLFPPSGPSYHFSCYPLFVSCLNWHCLMKKVFLGWYRPQEGCLCLVSCGCIILFLSVLLPQHLLCIFVCKQILIKVGKILTSSLTLDRGSPAHFLRVLMLTILFHSIFAISCKIRDQPIIIRMRRLLQIPNLVIMTFYSGFFPSEALIVWIHPNWSSPQMFLGCIENGKYILIFICSFFFCFK